MRSGSGPKSGQPSKVPCYSDKPARTGGYPGKDTAGSTAQNMCDFVIPKSEIVPIKVKK